MGLIEPEVSFPGLDLPYTRSTRGGTPFRFDREKVEKLYQVMVA